MIVLKFLDLGKNYLEKFLKPKRSYLSLLGVGQLICDNDLLEGCKKIMERERKEQEDQEQKSGGQSPDNKPASKPFMSLSGLNAKSTVTVTCNSLNGELLYIKAADFLKAMRKDGMTWKSFETH